MKTIEKKEYLSPRIDEREFRVESGIAASQDQNLWDIGVGTFDIQDFGNDFWAN